MFIYKITNLVNNKLYIGQTRRVCEVRWNEHLNDRGLLLGRAIRKYGKDCFKFELMFSANSQEELDFLEMLVIQITHSCDPYFGYNCREGGNSTSFSESSREKMSISQTGKKQSGETRKKRSLSMKGKNTGKQSEERRKQNSESHKGIYPSEEARRKNSESNRGKKHTKEAREKIAAANRGRKDSIGRRVKISIALKKYFKVRSIRTPEDIGQA